MVSAFERVVEHRSRAEFDVEPVAVAWNAVAFRVRGSREAIACVPRRELDAFFDDLDAGRLDRPILDFLGAPPSGRVLRAASQTRKPGLFDELVAPDAIAPPERIPRRGIGGHGGGPPSVARRDKRSRPPRPRRLLVGGAAVAAVVVVAAIALATRGGDDKAQPVATGVTTSTTLAVTGPTRPLPTGDDDCGVPGNLIQNCGFETPRAPIGLYNVVPPDGTMGAWTVGEGDSVDQTDVALENGIPVHGGTQSLDLNDLEAGLVFQNISTKVGQTYELTFYLSGFPSSAAGCEAHDPQTLEVAAGSVRNNFTFTPNQTTRGRQALDEHSFSFVADSSTTRIEFRSTTAGCTGPIIDDVSVV